jgi:hypothetical protein
MSFTFAELLESYACSNLPRRGEDYLRDPQKQALARLQSLVRGECGADKVAAAFLFAFGTDEPVQKVLGILQMPPDPIPCFPGSIGARPGALRQKSHTWTAYEDQRLIAGIHKYGLDNWHDVAEFIGNGRTRSQCAQRWNRSLNPHIFKGPWTAQQEEQLISLVKKYGEKAWKKIASEFGNRSDVQCRYHYQQIQRRDRPRTDKLPRPMEIAGPRQTVIDDDDISTRFTDWKDWETWN